MDETDSLANGTGFMVLTPVENILVVELCILVWLNSAL